MSDVQPTNPDETPSDQPSSGATSQPSALPRLGGAGATPPPPPSAPPDRVILGTPDQAGWPDKSTTIASEAEDVDGSW